MPKATLEFNLPEEQEEFDMAVSANKCYSCLWEIKDKLRSYYKYGHKFETADNAIEKIYEEVCEFISESNLEI